MLIFLELRKYGASCSDRGLKSQTKGQSLASFVDSSVRESLFDACYRSNRFGGISQKKDKVSFVLFNLSNKDDKGKGYLCAEEKKNAEEKRQG